jgi:hypothetical protein
MFFPTDLIPILVISTRTLPSIYPSMIQLCHSILVVVPSWHLVSTYLHFYNTPSVLAFHNNSIAFLFRHNLFLFIIILITIITITKT